jgi:hypothetical protein
MRSLIYLIILFTPNWLMAGEFYLEVSNESPGINELFAADVLVSTNDRANVVSGTFSFDKEFFDIERISTGNSIVGFWIEKPSERQDGLVSFSGMIAGGFSSTEAKLFSVNLKPKLVGKTALEMTDLMLLAHDGVGTSLPTSSTPLELVIDNNTSSNANIDNDTEAPENFTPELVKRDDWFDGKYVLVFNTTDKGSGVDAYYVKEVNFEFLAPFVSWRLVSSPYVIKDQTLRSFVFIKAEDRAGNSEVVEVVPSDPRIIWPFIVLTLVLIFVLLIAVRHRADRGLVTYPGKK